MKTTNLTVLLALLMIFIGCSKKEPNYEEVASDLSYLNSVSFKKIKTTFSIESSDLDFDKAFAVPSGVNEMKIKIIPVYTNGAHSAYLWMYYNTISNTYTTLYESLTFENSSLKSASLFSETNFFIVDLEFQKLEGGMRYVIGNSLSSKSPISLKGRAASMQSGGESYVDCVTRVYQTAKAACESDPVCDTLCDFTPGCHTNMLAAAAVVCIAPE